MKLSHRSKLSLVQLLATLSGQDLAFLIEKHLGFDSRDDISYYLREYIREAPDDKLIGILDELVRTWGALRINVSPKYVFDQRWEDLKHCLHLDGLLMKDMGRVEERKVVLIEPSLGEDSNVEDDLTAELQKTRLDQVDGILQSLSRSADDFRKTPVDYNGCLNNARVALQTFATAIAKSRLSSHPGSFDESKWGQVIAYLRTSGFITEEQEKGLAGVFGFVSPGSHVPIGMSEAETARLGRSFILGMCYFLAKLYNGQS